MSPLAPSTLTCRVRSIRRVSIFILILFVPFILVLWVKLIRLIGLVTLVLFQGDFYYFPFFNFSFIVHWGFNSAGGFAMSGSGHGGVTSTPIISQGFKSARGFATSGSGRGGVTTP